jgi:PAS domain S-box-containing protein
MEVSCRATRLAFEAAEAEGIARKDLVEGLGVDVAYLENVRNRIDWATFAAVLERLSACVDHDAERLQAIGDRMVRAPSYAFLQRLARLVVSQRVLFDAARRWVSPSLFPTITPEVELFSGNRVRLRGEIPAHYVGCEPFFRIWVGTARSLPTLLGLPRAAVRAEITPHVATLHLVLPPSPTLFERVRRSLRAMSGMGEIVDLLDSQQREVEESFFASLRTMDVFRTLLDTLPALVVMHRAGKILWVNRVLVETARYASADELVGRNLLELVHPSSHAAILQKMSTPVGMAQPIVVARLLRKDGTTITAEVAPAQEVQFAGGPARLVVGHDVSEHVLLQQRMVIADRMASLGLLGAGVAHEINNPLSYALASVELARASVSRTPSRDENEPDDLAEVLDTALDGIGRVRAIVNDLRALTRPDDDRVEPTDVQAVIESTLKLATTEIARRARIVRNYLPTPPAAASVPRLGQVALNLVLNAIEAMPERARADHELRVRTFVDDRDRVAFEIEDTGEGIAPDALGRIFDPFFTTKPIGEGTGLGLSVCHQIVTGFGGEITVRSEFGRGTTFRVALPAATSPRASKGKGGDDAAKSVRRARILVVDDEPRLVNVLRSMLAHHDVTAVTNARDALETLARDPRFDLVLCDLMMADMTGMDFFEELQTRHAALSDRVVFMTGGAFTPAARAFLETRSDRRLDKPFTMAELSRVVTRFEPST